MTAGGGLASLKPNKSMAEPLSPLADDPSNGKRAKFQDGYGHSLRFNLMSMQT